MMMGHHLDAHARDHDRLAAARAAWVKAGRPSWPIRDDPGHRKRQATRTFGLRLQAHMAVLHHDPHPLGMAFDDVVAQHDSLHQGKGAV